MNKKFYTFLFGMVIVSSSYSQSPGGVSTNLKLWLKANAGTNTTTNGAAVNTWNYANNGFNFTATPGQEPVYTASALNFQPALTFDGTKTMDGPTGTNAPIPALQDDYAVFAVWRSPTTAAFQHVWSQRPGSTSNSADGVSIATWNDGRYGDQVEIFPFDNSIQRPYTANTWNISQLNLLNQATGDLEIVDDRNIGTSPVTVTTDPSGVDGAGLRSLSDVTNRIGSRLGAGDESLFGDVAEVIVYDRPISGLERSKVFSYLSLKYGIPLSGNLVSSGGATLWDATANSTYNNAVFGIGIDNSSGLSMTQSSSILTGNGDGTGISGMGNIVLSNASALADQIFLFIGNDNGSLTESNTGVPLMNTGASKLGRNWKVQETGTPGTIDLTFDMSGLTLTGSTTADFKLMVDADGDGDFTTGTQRYYAPASINGSVLTFTGITLNNSEDFTILTNATVTLPVNWTAFTTQVVNSNNVQLSWSVANNEQAKQYQVEHSIDGVTYSVIGTVANFAAVKDYSFVHSNVAEGLHYYRILETDFDGNSIYSKINTVSILGNKGFSSRVLANPIYSGYADLEITTKLAAKASVEVWSSTGVRLATVQMTVNPGSNRTQIPLSQAAGMYILKINLNGTIQTIQVDKL